MWEPAAAEDPVSMRGPLCEQSHCCGDQLKNISFLQIHHSPREHGAFVHSTALQCPLQVTQTQRSIPVQGTVIDLMFSFLMFSRYNQSKNLIGTYVLYWSLHSSDNFVFLHLNSRLIFKVIGWFMCQFNNCNSYCKMYKNVTFNYSINYNTCFHWFMYMFSSLLLNFFSKKNFYVRMDTLGHRNTSSHRPVPFTTAD